MRVNFGCGQSPTPGWINCDNSLTVRLARHPWALALATTLGFLDDHAREFAAFARGADILWADATTRLPFPDGSVDVLYTSHMMEHLDSREVEQFLREARRVLKPEGVLRIAVPDLRKLVDAYVTDGDADRFVERTYMAAARPAGWRRRVLHAIVGPRQHLWMYDARSLIARLTRAGFTHVVVLPPGETTIADPGELDLSERADESLYVEARSGMRD